MLTSLLDLVNNKATAAAGFQGVPLATPKHHGPEGRNDLQINRKNKFHGGRNVPSEILLEIFSYPAIVLESSLILLSSFFETLLLFRNTPPFSKHSRNGPPNFVPKMTQNQSQEQVPWRPERPF